MAIGGLKSMANKKKNNNSSNKEKDVPEKRAVPRIKREITVQYTVKELPRANGIQVSFEPFTDITRTKDLSEGGVSFTASHLLSAGTILDLKLQLPLMEESFDLEGRLVSCTEIRKNIIYAIGVEFINLKEEQKQLLKKFVELFLKSQEK